MKLLISFCCILIGSSSFAQRCYVELWDIITPSLVIENKVQGVILDEKEFKTRISYDIFGKKEKIEEYEGRELISTDQFHYSQEKLDSIVTKSSLGEWLNNAIYYYNANGKLQRKEGWDFSKNKTLETFYYNPSGNLIKSKYTQTFYWGQTCLTDYSYDELDRIDTIFMSDCIDHLEYTVDTHTQNKLISLYYGVKGEVIEKRITRFNDSDQPVLTEVFSFTNEIIEKTTFQYSSNGLLKEVQYFSKQKNNFKKPYHVVTLEYRY